MLPYLLMCIAYGLFGVRALVMRPPLRLYWRVYRANPRARIQIPKWYTLTCLGFEYTVECGVIPVAVRKQPYSIWGCIKSFAMTFPLTLGIIVSAVQFGVLFLYGGTVGEFAVTVLGALICIRLRADGPLGVLERAFRHDPHAKLTSPKLVAVQCDGQRFLINPNNPDPDLSRL